MCPSTPFDGLRAGAQDIRRASIKAKYPFIGHVVYHEQACYETKGADFCPSTPFDELRAGAQDTKFRLRRNLVEAAGVEPGKW
jgi:hypothetical protein